MSGRKETGAGWALAESSPAEVAARSTWATCPAARSGTGTSTSRKFPTVGSAAGRGVSGCDRAPPQVAYAQPPQGAYYPPPQQGYAPPQQGYAPPPQGYAPPQDQQGYAPPPPAPPAYYPAAAPAYAYYDVPGYYYAPPPVTVFAPPLGYYWYHGRYWGGRGGRRWR